MMQAAFNQDTQAQTSVSLKEMDYDSIMAMGYPFVPVKRVNVNQEGVNLEQEVELTCVEGGTPIVLEGWHKHPKWDSKLFTFQYIETNHGNEEILCRDLTISEDVPMLMTDYIRKVHAASLLSSASQPETSNGARSYDLPITPPLASPLVAGGGEPSAMPVDESLTSSVKPDEDTIMEDVQRDIRNTSEENANLNKETSSNDPTTTAKEQRKRVTRSTAVKLPPLLYAKDVTCPMAWHRFLMDGILPGFLGYMRENDLNNLNTKLAAENLMIYIGQAGTWTPAHIDQCGAVGHNIMAWADNDSSSMWFMIRAEDKAKAEELWKLFGHPLEYEGYFASVDQLRAANFPIYVVNQKIGDFVMVPSLGYHQVINLGRATLKVSWNRLTAHCLKAAVNVVLPRYREIARPEAYRIRTIIMSALVAWTDLLKSQTNELPLSKEGFCQSFKDILGLFRTITEEEWVDTTILRIENHIFKKPRRLTDVAPAVCDFCSSDLWNRQFHCLKCSENDDNYDVCTRCFTMGRGCLHRATSMEFVEAFSMRSCQRLYSEGIRAWNESTVLSGCQGHATIVDEWINGKNNVEHQAILEPTREPALSFTRPEDDERNRGGVSDNMIRTFASTSLESGDEVEKDELLDSGRNLPRTKAAAPAHSNRFSQSKKRLQPRQESEMRKRRAPSTNRSSKATPSRDSSFALADANSDVIRITRTELESLMGVQEEMALRYAYSNGLRRTLQSIQSKQEMAQTYYRELFQMDAYFMNKSKDIHNNFRKDILESHSAKKRAASESGDKQDIGDGTGKH
ncbi:hypothetical protein BGX27_004311 [Mortierella sp. AM989]|nr:hypothetical protein BGX27_004311 [Mortierella sp. AM989]